MSHDHVVNACQVNERSTKEAVALADKFAPDVIPVARLARLEAVTEPDLLLLRAVSSMRMVVVMVSVAIVIVLFVFIVRHGLVLLSGR